MCSSEPHTAFRKELSRHHYPHRHSIIDAKVEFFTGYAGAVTQAQWTPCLQMVSYRDIPQTSRFNLQTSQLQYYHVFITVI